MLELSEFDIVLIIMLTGLQSMIGKKIYIFALD